ncbi:MAG: saccharopine dehydrogenase family protein [Candidatus Hodarchaeales archaeon]|jgi:saccharopine dehydrogenase (NAD+, L-lysine-forming)
MAKIIVLGGCGVVGSIAVKTLISIPDFFDVIIGDIDFKKAQVLVSTIGSNKLSAKKVDAMDPNSIKSAIKDSDIVLNCIGPAYKFTPLILKVVIETGKNYVDVCDDVDATREILKMNDEAKRAGISAVIGMGSSPGVTNLLAKFAADHLLEEVDSIDLYHAHGGEPSEGAGVIAHRLHSMIIDIPIFMDGKFQTTSFFGDDGLQEEVNFQKLGKFKVYPYPHPETITLPKFIKGVKRVTNKGVVLPPEYFQLITDIVKLGIVDEKPLNVKGNMISPFDFSIEYIINQRDKILRETNFGTQRGCVKIVVKGKKDGKTHQYVFSLASEDQAMGEGTGIPLALTATLLQRGLIEKKGVLPPEGCINPLDFLTIMQEVLKLDKIVGDEKSPLLIESIDEHGKIEVLTLP